MPATRKSARIAEQPSSQDNDITQTSPKPAAGQKRKNDASSPPGKAKRGKKEQKTLEEVMPTDDALKQERRDDEPDDAEMKEAAEQVEEKQDAQKQSNGTKSDSVQQNGESKQPEKSGEDDQKAESKSEAPTGDDKKEPEASSDNDEKEPEVSGEEKAKADTSNDDIQGTSRMDDTGAIHKNEEGKEAKDAQAHPNGAIKVSEDRKQAEPSNILEKGIIYFFIRGRVGTGATPDSPDEIQRAYMVLRPLPDGTKLSEGAIPELKNCRLLALPKKVWPKSPQDRFMCFVEKAETDVKELKEDFMKGSDYATKTTGTNHTPTVTPIGEGPYAITTQGRDSHLAYMITIPDQIGEVQKDIGLAKKGSFVLSTKNPEFAGPANSNLPESPAFPKEILEEFRSLRWMGTQPKHMDYANAQFLLIGEAAGDFGRAAEQTEKDAKHGKETPAEELEKLEDEDQFRAEALKGDNAVFADLGISHDDYPKVQTTW